MALDLPSELSETETIRSTAAIADGELVRIVVREVDRAVLARGPFGRCGGTEQDRA